MRVNTFKSHYVDYGALSPITLTGRWRIVEDWRNKQVLEVEATWESSFLFKSFTTTEFLPETQIYTEVKYDIQGCN